MKKLLLFFLALAGIASVSAQTVPLSYCNGEMASSTNYKVTQRGWLECALRLPAPVLAAYDGGQIDGVRAAIVKRLNTDSLVVWVRTSLDGPNLAEKLIRRSGTTPTLQQGWNEVLFDTPYQLDNVDNDLFVGFSIFQKTGQEIISQVQPIVPGSSYYRFNGGTWKDISATGVVSVEALMGGDKLPVHDMGIFVGTICPSPTTSSTAMQATLFVHNFGTQPLTGYSVQFDHDGTTVAPVSVTQTIEPGQTLESQVIFEPGVETDEHTVWTATITGLTEGDDEVAANNATQPTYGFLRNVLIEEFTTERCPNCPSVAELLHDMLSKKEYADRVYAVAHHAGYYTDSYTLDADYDYLGFYYAISGTFAPALMMNRRPIYPNYDSPSQQNTIFLPSSQEQVEGYANTELRRGADVMLDLALAYNADSTSVTVTVGARKNSNYTTDNPYLNVYLLENDIYTRNQNGSGGEFYHQHVKRQYNSSWGSPVNWDGNDFSYTYTFDLEDGWNKDNMEVLAFIYNYGYSYANREVDNCVRLKLKDAKSEITGILPATGTHGAATVVARYDLMGRPVTEATKGVQLIRLSDGTVQKVVNR